MATDISCIPSQNTFHITGLKVAKRLRYVKYLSGIWASLRSLLGSLD